MPNQSDNLEVLRVRINSEIEYFLSNIPIELREKLDYSVDSLAFFEKWLLQQYKHQVDFLEDADEQLVNGVVFYIGETYRKHVGGQWDFDSEQLEYARHFSETAVLRDVYKGETEDEEPVSFYEKLHHIIAKRIPSTYGTLKRNLELTIETIIRLRKS